MIRNYTALDIETTGLNPKLDKIIEVGAVRIRNGQVDRQYQSLINPGRKLKDSVKELTGITDEELLKAREVSEVIPDLLDFIGEDILLGHSILFDYSFIKKSAVNLDLQFEKDGIDTLKIARRFLPKLESRSLSFLCSYYGIAHNAHRALEDALAAMHLYEKLAQNFETGQGFQPCRLVYQVKKEAPASIAQKERLYKLADKHKLVVDYEIDKLTRNEASRFTDQIILQYGR